jgi:quercetin dioxygenase-like cupin family protein
MADDIHADRRDPETPDHPVDLATLGEELLAQARELKAGRSARTLTPEEHGALKQTLLALTSGSELSEHHTNGPATIHVIRGAATLTQDGTATELTTGQWATIPRDRHGLVATDDLVALLTVAPTA